MQTMTEPDQASTQSVTKGIVRMHKEDESEPPQDEPSIQRREIIYEKIQRVQASTKP